MTRSPVHTPAWRRFRRMQAAACLFAILIYAAAGVHAWRVLPGAASLKRALILVFPSVFLMAALWAPLQFGFIRRPLKRYVWLCFVAGFGQTPTSVLTGLAVLAVAAGFIFAQVIAAQHGGRYPAGVFSGYGAGIGILLAQALLTIRLEREPKVRDIIER